MPKTEHTHDVAERTEKNGDKVRVETTRTAETSRSETRRVDIEGEPKQIKPDGR